MNTYTICNRQVVLTATLVLLLPWRADRLNAQEIPPPQSTAKEPEYINQFFRLGSDGQLISLEREKFTFEMKSHRNFVISPSVTTEHLVPNPASPVRVPPAAVFVVRLRSGDVDPTTLVTLKPFVVKKKNRQLPQSKASAGLIPFSGVKSQTAPDSSIAISVKKFGANSFQVQASQPLPPGEYAFITGQEASCFGVDANPAQQ